MKEWPQDTYVLIPSYKSVNPLKRFIDSLTEVAPKEFICVVDDASDDGTYEFCESVDIKCIRHRVNKGKGAALKTGFAYLTGGGADADTAGGSGSAEPKKNAKWILTMDADGQHSPADIYRFIKEAERYPAMGLCIGARDMRLGMMPPARILSNRLTSAALSILTRQLIKDSQCGYRLYSRGLITSIDIEHSRFEMESEVILKAAAKRFPIRFARVQTLYLKDGQSHISHLADTLRWIRAVLRVWHSAEFRDKNIKKNRG
jgi:glycosyltransferase involved in cell wall biosynthesis